MPDLITLTKQGLWCEPGGFHIDPWARVDRAIITHAHADHARPGSSRYLTAASGERVLRTRLGKTPPIDALPWRKPMTIGDATVTLYPAGHVLGSSQVHVQAKGYASWIVTGDYKTQPGAACEPWEPVRADVLLTESTFALPIYRWRPEDEVASEINAWWARNRDAGRTSLILAYSLGKAQRVQALLDESIGPIGVHGAIAPLNSAYQAGGIRLPKWHHVTDENRADFKGRGVVVAPPATADTPWARKLAGPEGVATAMASGWMAVRGRRRWTAVDRGFVLSDHADWDGLNLAVRECGAERVGVTHGSAQTFARWVREQGTESFVVPTRFVGETAGAERPDNAADALHNEPPVDPPTDLPPD